MEYNSKFSEILKNEFYILQKINFFLKDGLNQYGKNLKIF